MHVMHYVMQMHYNYKVQLSMALEYVLNVMQ